MQRARRSRHPPSAGEPLTERETQVLALAAAGEPTPAISQRLGIAENTVKSHLTRIYDKTGSRNRVDAVRYYLDTYTLGPQQPGVPTARSTASARARRQPSLLHRQIQEIDARIDQLKPAARELERLRRAREALRAAAADDPDANSGAVS